VHQAAEKWLGREHAVTITTLTDLALALKSIDQRTEAIMLLRDAVDRQESANGPDSKARTTLPSRYERRSSASSCMVAYRSSIRRAIAFSQIATSLVGASGFTLMIDLGFRFRTLSRVLLDSSPFSPSA